PFTYVGGAYPGTLGNCGASLASLASCDLHVQFNPSGVGLVTDTIVMNYNDGAAAQVLNHGLQGTGAAPASISISDANPYDFGSVTENSSVNHVFTLTNGGGVPATALAVIGLAAPFAFTGGTFPGT